MIEHHGNTLVKKHSKKGDSMLELGDQIMNLVDYQGMCAKGYYTKLGYNHISLDINSKNGSVYQDFRNVFDLGKKFNIITDFGTIEHINGDLLNILISIFRHCEEGGVFIHKNPKNGNFPLHGVHYFTTEFWRKYAIECKLDVVDLYEYPIYHNTNDGWEVVAVLRKTSNSLELTDSGWDRIKGFLKTE